MRTDPWFGQRGLTGHLDTSPLSCVVGREARWQKSRTDFSRNRLGSSESRQFLEENKGLRYFVCLCDWLVGFFKDEALMGLRLGK